jgi:GTP pyrophosphokinase
MVTLKKNITYLDDGNIDLTSWIQYIRGTYHLNSTQALEKACFFAEKTGRGLTTFYGQPCLEQGLEMAEMLLQLKLDPETASAALILSSFQHSKTSIELISDKLSSEIAKLVKGTQQFSVIQHFKKNTAKTRDTTQIDKLRKLFLAMASDIRIVLIKLIERTSMMRNIKHIAEAERRHIAQETMEIYAPLANRLGIGQIKWELEDSSFHYLDPITYKKIAADLADRLAIREERINTLVSQLQQTLHEQKIDAVIYGRAKHIFSIYSKMQRKNVSYEHIFDISAVRVLVNTIDDCYKTLSVVHTLWNHIAEEFDDYIATPKANGYRSIHTAVIGPDTKNLEIQIRTHDMNEEAERGVAAHWLYKETKPSSSDYEAKIAFLQQLVDWHKEVAKTDDAVAPAYDELFSDRVYVFTPMGEILDLTKGATPLDCAYQIHTDIGNRCKGAKINGNIVPLTYSLMTGDQIEILTNSNGHPSRDWLNPDFGYLKTSRARAKVSHWFRQQDQSQHIENGKRILERELPRANLNLQKLSTHFGFKTDDNFLAAISFGHIRPAQIAHAIELERTPPKTSTPVITHKKTESHRTGTVVAGLSTLLTRIAKCCKPIPGDEVIGFITLGRGVSIHKKTCSNIFQQPERLIEVSWDNEHLGTYQADLLIRAHNRDTLLKEITTLLANAKSTLTAYNSSVSRDNLLIIAITVQISSLAQLKEITVGIQHLKGVISASRP